MKDRKMDGSEKKEEEREKKGKGGWEKFMLKREKKRVRQIVK